jgi:hypothetical protein
MRENEVWCDCSSLLSCLSLPSPRSLGKRKLDANPNTDACVPVPRIGAQLWDCKLDVSPEVFPERFTTGSRQFSGVACRRGCASRN